MPLVISPCTNRKTLSAGARASGLFPGALEAVGSDWLAALAGSPETTAAGRLYQGRSHGASSDAAGMAGATHLIVSAGLGLVSTRTEVPSYAASVIEGPDCLISRMTDATDAVAWWCWLQANSPFSESLAAHVQASDGPILIGLPQAYLAMVTPELLDLGGKARSRIRLFTAAPVGGPLAALRMPYDARLDGPQSDCAGTRSDFAARALLHFCRKVLPKTPDEGVEGHRSAVEAALANWKPATVRIGARKDDDELRLIIDAHWDAQKGHVARLLRVLRDDLGIACEQRRFARLAQSIRRERAVVQ